MTYWATHSLWDDANPSLFRLVDQHVDLVPGVVTLVQAAAEVGRELWERLRFNGVSAELRQMKMPAK